MHRVRRISIFHSSLTKVLKEFRVFCSVVRDPCIGILLFIFAVVHLLPVGIILFVLKMLYFIFKIQNLQKFKEFVFNFKFKQFLIKFKFTNSIEKAMYIRGSYNSSKTWLKVIALSIAFFLVNILGDVSFNMCQRSLQLDYPSSPKPALLYMATMIFFCFGTFSSFIIVKAANGANCVCIIATLASIPIHFLCFFVFKNTNPLSLRLVPDKIGGAVYFCYVMYGIGQGLIFSTILSMVGIVVKPLDTGKSFTIVWSTEIAGIFVSILLNGKLFQDNFKYFFDDFKRAIFLLNVAAIVIFALIPRIEIQTTGEDQPSEENKNLSNFYKSLRNCIKMLPILGVFDAFKYFNEFYYYQQKSSGDLFINLLKVLFGISSLIIAGEFFDSSRNESQHLIHLLSLFTMIFMFFGMTYSIGLLNWILVILLSITYTSIPVITSSWVRYYYKDDILQSFSLYGTFYGVMRILISLFMDKGLGIENWKTRLFGIGSILGVAIAVWLLGGYKPTRYNQKEENRRLID